MPGTWVKKKLLQVNLMDQVPGIEYDLYNFQIGTTVVGSVKDLESAQNQS